MPTQCTLHYGLLLSGGLQWIWDVGRMKADVLQTDVAHLRVLRAWRDPPGLHRFLLNIHHRESLPILTYNAILLKNITIASA